MTCAEFLARYTDFRDGLITAPRDVRAKRRLIADDRERRLLPEEEKIRLGDYAYVNDGTLAELDAFVAGVMADLVP